VRRFIHQLSHSHHVGRISFSGYTEVAEIQDAYKLLSPLLGVSAASAIFALALLASGQSSTLTATLAGQIVMEGFAAACLPGCAV